MPHQLTPWASRSLPGIGSLFFAASVLAFSLFDNLLPTAWLALNTTSSFAQSVSITDVLDASGNPAQVGDTINQAIRVNQVAGGGGAVTANQGAPNTIANAWPTRICDLVDCALVTAAGQVEINATSLPLPTGAATEFTLSTRLAESTFTGRFASAFLSADTIANQTTTPVHSFAFGFNGATWDRLRSSITNGLQVDVTRVTGNVSVIGTITANAGVGTFTVGGTVTANQGAPNTTANRWPVQLTDGTTLNTMTGSSININCTGGCGSASQAATYTAEITSSASAATKDYLSIFNAAGSGRIIRLVRVTVAQGNTAAVAGLSANLNIIRTSTAGVTCTTVTVQNNIDTTNAAVPAQITAATNCTTDPVAVSTIRHCSISVEETSGGAKKEECYLFDNNGGQPITLREGQGLMLRNTALAPVGLLSASMEVTF